MKILQVITDTDRRGAQQFALDLGDGLRSLGHDVETVALAPGNLENPIRIEALGLSRFSIATLRALRRRMAEVDITVAHGSSTAPACALAGPRGRPFVYRQISDPGFWAGTWLRRLRVALYVRRAAHVVCLSDAVADYFRQHYWLSAATTTVIPNAVPGDRFKPSREERLRVRSEMGFDDDSPVVLYVGALVEEKGVDLAISAVAEVDGVNLVIAGGGVERQRLEGMASKLMPGRCHLTGPVSDPVPLYQAADLLIFPTRGGDSMPAVLIESGLCALPAVACPVGAITDVVRDHQTGLVVGIDDREGLIAAVRHLVANAELRSRLGEEARRHCLERFTIEPVAREWDAVLRRCAASRP